MNKQQLIKKIVAHLTGELELFAKAARAAHAEATHEQSKAENKYDTRGLEASYLARGQSRQVAETAAALEQIEKMVVREFSAKDPIDLGALVELQGKGKAGRSFYFLAPRAGGTEIEQDQKEVLVITPQAPLGQQLMGKKQGERLEIEIAGSRDEYRIVSVS